MRCKRGDASGRNDPPMPAAEDEFALAEWAQREHAQPFGSRVPNGDIGDHELSR